MKIRTIDLEFLGTAEAIAVYLMETDDGPILFETGPYSCLPKLEEGLSKYGYTTDDIKHVFLTHIHLDHAGAAWYFAEKGAHIYVHPIGHRHLLDTTKLVESATKIYKDQMDYLWGAFRSVDAKQMIVAHHEERFEVYGHEIKSLHTPGHASHHIAWKTSEGIICGDVAGIRMGNGPAVVPCPPPDIHLEYWRRSIDILLAEKPEKIYLSHFGAYEEAVAHLQQLRNEINALDLFVSGLYNNDQDIKNAFVPFGDWFEKRVQSLTNDSKLTERYCISNPPWMSIRGLYRYYSKQKENIK
jgi:glyoxylase-like metal-dependent hydrolase (beta-lactamase superfamily II)